MKKFILTMLIGSLSFAAHAAVTITNFGTSSFALDLITSFTTTQTATSAAISGSDFGSSVIGGITPAVSIVGNTANLTLSGSMASAPASAFTITLFDGDYKQAIYTGGSWSALASTGLSVLNFGSSDNGFNFSNIIGLDLTANGAGTAISATLTGLTAGVVPEPTRALLLGVGLMGLMMRRRR